MFAKLACRPLKFPIEIDWNLDSLSWSFQTPTSNKMAIKSKLLLFTVVIIIVPLFDFSLCVDFK